MDWMDGNGRLSSGLGLGLGHLQLHTIPPLARCTISSLGQVRSGMEGKGKHRLMKVFLRMEARISWFEDGLVWFGFRMGDGSNSIQLGS